MYLHSLYLVSFLSGSPMSMSFVSSWFIVVGDGPVQLLLEFLHHLGHDFFSSLLSFVLVDVIVSVSALTHFLWLWFLELLFGLLLCPDEECFD